MDENVEKQFSHKMKSTVSWFIVIVVKFGLPIAILLVMSLIFFRSLIAKSWRNQVFNFYTEEKNKTIKSVMCTSLFNPFLACWVLFIGKGVHYQEDYCPNLIIIDQSLHSFYGCDNFIKLQNLSHQEHRLFRFHYLHL